jgi:hypothetical protein
MASSVDLPGSRGRTKRLTDHPCPISHLPIGRSAIRLGQVDSKIITQIDGELAPSLGLINFAIRAGIVNCADWAT